MINYYITIFVFFCVHIIRLVILKKNICVFSITNYLRSIIIPAVIIILTILFIIYWTKDLITSNFIRLIYIIIVNTTALLLCGFKIALNKKEQKFISDFLLSKLNAIRRVRRWLTMNSEEQLQNIMLGNSFGTPLIKGGELNIFS